MRIGRVTGVFTNFETLGKGDGRAGRKKKKEEGKEVNRKEM